jgi:hypothetical protein
MEYFWMESGKGDPFRCRPMDASGQKINVSFLGEVRSGSGGGTC